MGYGYAAFTAGLKSLLPLNQVIIFRLSQKSGYAVLNAARIRLYDRLAKFIFSELNSVIALNNFYLFTEELS